MNKPPQQPKRKKAAAPAAKVDLAGATADDSTQQQTKTPPAGAGAGPATLTLGELQQAVTAALEADDLEGVDALKPTHIIVKARDDRGFRRAGRFWPAVETTLPFDDFTTEQIEALVSEPELEVVFQIDGAPELGSRE